MLYESSDNACRHGEVLGQDLQAFGTLWRAVVEQKAKGHLLDGRLIADTQETQAGFHPCGFLTWCRPTRQNNRKRTPRNALPDPNRASRGKGTLHVGFVPLPEQLF